MEETKDLFSQSKTDEAIKKGFENANEEWKSLALEAVHNLCLKQKTFTADDIRFVLTPEMAETHDRRAMGGVMKRAQKEKWCKATGIHVKSKYTHGHLHQVWESLLVN